MSKDAIGSNGEKIIVFYQFKDVREFNNFKTATESIISGMVLQSTVFMIFVKEESQKNELPEAARFNYISSKDFNIFGQLKDKNRRELIKSRFDILMVFDEIEPKHVRLINKVKAAHRIVSSRTEGINFDIRLNASSVKIEQIASFAKETLEKIQK